jgi:HPt (histidine-containing phosphotransfer) domain-containing protein
MVGDDPAFLGELVDEFLADAPAQLAAMRAAADAGDAERLVRPAHTLKGTSANLGAAELAAVCRTLEEQAKSGSVAGAGELIGQVQLALERAAAELEAARGRGWDA